LDVWTNSSAIPGIQSTGELVSDPAKRGAAEGEALEEEAIAIGDA